MYAENHEASVNGRPVMSAWHPGLDYTHAHQVQQHTFINKHAACIVSRLPYLEWNTFRFCLL